MPKVATIDAKTGLKTGASAEQSGGRTIKAITNTNPSGTHKVETDQGPQPVSMESQKTNTEASPEVKQLDPHHEALAKKESAIRAREREIQAREAAIEDRVKAAINEALNGFKGQLKQSPLDVLDREGITYDQLVEQAVNYSDPAYQSSRKLQEQVKMLEEKLSKFEEGSKKATETQRESAIKQIRYDVQDLVEADASYETIKATGSIDDVVQLIERTFNETGRVMSTEQAAKMVEEELLEEAIKIANLSKVKAKLAPPVEDEKQQSPQQATTLTNQMTANRKLTARERAIMRFKGEKF